VAAEKAISEVDRFQNTTKNGDLEYQLNVPGVEARKLTP
jgi:hypothetical protein